MAKFEEGKTYTFRSISNSNLVYKYTVIKRTDKTITTKNEYDEIRRSKIQIEKEDGSEWSYPEGRYSFCPIIHA